MQASYKIALIASLIGVIPVFVWFWMIAKKNHWGIKKSDLFLKVFFWGVVSVILASVIEIYFIETGKEDLFVDSFRRVFSGNEGDKLAFTLGTVFFIALAEEFSKGMAITYSIFRFKMEKLTDGLIFGMIVGLAFGATENGVYFVSGIEGQQPSVFWGIVILRFLLSTSAHVVYSGLMGLILAEVVKLKSFVGKVWVTCLAFCVPISFHSAFNFLLDSEFNFLIIFVILFGFLLIYFGYKLNQDEEPEKYQINQ